MSGIVNNPTVLRTRNDAAPIGAGRRRDVNN